jgi:hypothetical protein
VSWRAANVRAKNVQSIQRHPQPRGNAAPLSGQARPEGQYSLHSCRLSRRNGSHRPHSAGWRARQISVQWVPARLSLRRAWRATVLFDRVTMLCLIVSPSRYGPPSHDRSRTRPCDVHHATQPILSLVQPIPSQVLTMMFARYFDVFDLDFRGIHCSQLFVLEFSLFAQCAISSCSYYTGSGSSLCRDEN